MWWYYDLVVIAVLVLCIWNGMRKGLSHSLMQLAATILSAVIAFAISQPLSEFCYTEFLEEPMVSALEQKLNTVDVAGVVQEKLTENGIPVSEEQVQTILADPDGVAAQYGIDAAWLNEQVNAAAVYVEEMTNGVLPEWLVKEVALDGASQLDTAKAVLSGNTRQAAETLVLQYGKPVFCTILQIILFGFCFFLLLLLLQAITACFPMRQMGTSTDMALGAVAGVLKACVLLWFMVLLTRSVVSATQGTDAFFTESCIQKTYLFQLLY